MITSEKTLYRDTSACGNELSNLLEKLDVERSEQFIEKEIERKVGKVANDCFPLCELPGDILREIISFLKGRDVKAVIISCKLFKALLSTPLYNALKSSEEMTFSFAKKCEEVITHLKRSNIQPQKILEFNDYSTQNVFSVHGGKLYVLTSIGFWVITNGVVEEVQTEGTALESLVMVFPYGKSGVFTQHKDGMYLLSFDNNRALANRLVGNGIGQKRQVGEFDRFYLFETPSTLVEMNYANGVATTTDITPKIAEKIQGDFWFAPSYTIQGEGVYFSTKSTQVEPNSAYEISASGERIQNFSSYKTVPEGAFLGGVGEYVYYESKSAIYAYEKKKMQLAQTFTFDKNDGFVRNFFISSGIFISYNLFKIYIFDRFSGERLSTFSCSPSEMLVGRVVVVENTLYFSTKSKSQNVTYIYRVPL